MIIVSQDKENITKNLELSINCIVAEEDDFPIINTEVIGYAIIERKYGLQLGIYKTKKRAKEVLNEIYTAYSNWRNLEEGQPQGTANPVYEMPED